MREFVKCLMKSNRRELGKIGKKVSIEFEYKILKNNNENHSDVSLKILDFKPVALKKSIWNDFRKYKGQKENKLLENFEVEKDCVLGHKKHSYYFFMINEKGENNKKRIIEE